ncbi:RNA polymerase sigma-70 factor, ECF subfamily [Pedobacter westerhofensis]|uniref:RNA polymerase sigma-70 factor, ECF subfamily n=1 Tax=Pedobacter westerhofensis TaxID=425512 RepID=A0A521AXL8_9SPHI|nr:sigma-70 family RNA polymerase sigma factor [Pedobacter westerhofensis]SMO39565.1 RNA polymerase sigma-70 factor, ECF subfamily [Pedobacter westerhofensis]
MTGSGITYEKMTDDDLLFRLKNDDHLAFTEIFNRYSQLLYAHAYNKLRIESDARDVLQEMFMKFWDKRSSLEQGNNLAGYLFIALRNTIFNLIKSRSRVSAYAETFTQVNADSGIYTDTLIREKQFSAMIEAEIANLPPRMRAVFELRRKEHLSNKEVAARLGITESTSADQMKKAVRILKNKIGLVWFVLYYLNIK